MRNEDFDAFIKDGFNLVRSIVVKVEEQALAYNEALEAIGYSVSEDKTTWRYYMNLAGDYHPLDDEMIVKSIDTGEDIVFNKANLETHLATFREYSEEGYWKDRLKLDYPHQTDLIRGILSPIPYEETIGADNYKILAYNENLVLWNEDQLIPDVQKAINSEAHAFLAGNEYSYTENLMDVVLLCNLTATIFKAINNSRFKAIGTRHAHEFYIWSHIDSFGSFSKYKNSLDHYQTMWLYRNIHWLINHAGRIHNFEELLENLLTYRQIPLSKYDMVLNTTGQEESFIPTPLYRKSNLNLLNEYGNVDTYTDTIDIVNRTKELATDNESMADDHILDVTKAAQFSLFSETPTKVLESSMVDTTDSHLDTKIGTVYNNWIYLTDKGTYKSSLLITNPKNAAQFRMTPGDAYYLWLYLVRLANGETLEYIEPAWYERCLRIETEIPSIEEIMYYGTIKDIDRFIAQDIRRLSYSYGIIISSDKLLSSSNEVYNIKWRHKKLYSQFHDLNKRAVVKAACDRMYVSGYATGLTEFSNYQQLLEHYELDLSEFTTTDLNIFSASIFLAATAYVSDGEDSLENIQTRLLDLMSDLSSYTVQIIQKITNGGQGTTELMNESHVDVIRFREPPTHTVADFTACQLDTRPTVRLNADTSLISDIPGVNKLETVSTSSLTDIKLVDDTVVLSVTPDVSNHFLSATRFTDNTQLRLISPNPESVS